MPLTMFPAISISSFSSAKTGSVVRYEKHLALLLPEEPKRMDGSRGLAACDPDGGGFRRLYRQSPTSLLDFGNDLVLQVKGTGQLLRPDENSDMVVFICDSGPCIVMRIGEHQEWRFVNLHTGDVHEGDRSPRWAFRHWKLGVKGAMGKPLWLIKVPGAQTAPAPLPP